MVYLWELFVVFYIVRLYGIHPDDMHDHIWNATIDSPKSLNHL